MSRFYKPKHDRNPWKLKEGSLRYNNPWLSVFHDDVITPGGSAGLYGTVHFKNHAIGILPVDREGFTWLVGQYRYPLKRWSWEIPEGGCPLGTDPLDSAKRELKEETGLDAGSWELLQEIDISNCVSDETGFIYLARDITVGEPDPDESEELEIIRLPLSEANDMVLNGEITDTISIIALLRAKMMDL